MQYKRTTGIWHDGKTAAGHPVIIQCMPEKNCLGITLAAQQEPESPPAAVWPLEAVAAPEPVAADSPLVLRKIHDDGQRLAINGRQEKHLVLEWLRPAQRARRQRLLRNWVAAAFCVWLGFAVLYAGSSYALRVFAALTPQSLEENIGKSAHDQLLSAFTTLTGEDAVVVLPRNNPLDELLYRLQSADPDNAYTYRVTVVRSALVNALSLPGGYIILFSGLVEDCEDPDELAGVLAHEMAHIQARHGLSHYIGSLLWNTLLRIGGGSGNVSGAVGELLSLMMSSRYSREAEQEADLQAVECLYRAGIDPYGLIRFFARLDRREATSTLDLPVWLDFSYLQSHPALKDRMAYLHEAVSRMQKNGASFAPSMTTEEWLEMRRLSKLPPSEEDRTVL